MKSYSLIGVLGAGFAAIAFGACTVTSTTNNNGDDAGNSSSSSGGGDDSGIDGASSSGSSSGSTSSSGSSSGTTSSSGSSSGGVAEGGEGGTCNVSFAVGSPTCDSCVQASCCSQLTMCDSSDAGGGPADDAGTECYNALSCAILLAGTHPDAALSTMDINDCAMSDGGTTTGGTTAISVFTCVMDNCASACQ